MKKRKKKTKPKYSHDINDYVILEGTILLE